MSSTETAGSSTTERRSVLGFLAIAACALCLAITMMSASTNNAYADCSTDGHTWGDPVITWSSYKATAKWTCSTCSTTYSASCTVTNAITTAATCTSTGVRTYTATAPTTYTDGSALPAGTATKTASISKLSHSYNAPALVWNADHTSVTGTFVCKNCGTTTTGTASGTYQIRSTVTTPATCLEEGVTTYTISFSSPSYTATDTATIPALGHSYGVPNFTFYNNNAKAKAVWTCTNDSSHKVSADATVTSKVSKEPTCTVKGYTTYTATIEAGTDSLGFALPAGSGSTSVQNIPALGHEYGDPVITFSEDGKTATATWSCIRDCGKTITKDCTVTSEVTTQPTCHTKGITTYTATIAADEEAGLAGGTDTTTRNDVATTAHTWGDPVITFDKDGKRAAASWTCTVDGCDFTKIDWCTVTDQITTPATCEEMGVTTYTATAGGTDEFGQALPEGTDSCEVTDVPATGHSWGTAAIMFSTDGKTATATWTCENDRSHKITLDCEVTSEVTTPATCENDGITTYTATAAGVDEDGQVLPTRTGTKAVANLPAFGHDWDNLDLYSMAFTNIQGRWVWTCNTCGEKWYVPFTEGWYSINGITRYVDGNGYAMVGWLQYYGDTYYLNETNGNLMTGWQKIDGSWYYLAPSEDGTWTVEVGIMQTGWQQIDGSWYYLDPASGIMKTGWLKSGSSWYYLKAGGKMAASQWVKINGSYYYFNANGKMATGWIDYKDKCYYCLPSGKMATGKTLINGKYYTFSASGAWDGKKAVTA